MNFFTRLFYNLLPSGFAWRIFGDTQKIIQGIGVFFNRAKLFVEQGIKESRPISANEELENWYNALGIQYEPSLGLAERQARASQVYSSLGGQSLGYIESVIQKAFPFINLEPFDVPYQFMAGKGMAGQMQAYNYPVWVPLAFQDGTFPVFIYRVTGEIGSQRELIQLQDILARVAPVRLEPLFVGIEALPETMMAGIGEAGRGMAGRFPNQV